jgi:hypothetical protein
MRPRASDFQGRGKWGIAALAALFLSGAAFAQGQGTGVLPGGGVGTYGPPFTAQAGHMSFGNGSAPSINSACGTGPVAPVGTDSAFFFTSGTGSSSSCQAIPATPWKQRPTCSVDAQSATQPAWSVGPTGTVNLTGVADSTTYNVICIGQPGG